MTEDPTAATALVPVRQQTVDFYGDQLVAAETSDAQIYVPVRPVVEALGLDWSAQSRRLRRDPILAEGLRAVAIRATPTGPQEMICLPGFSSVWSQPDRDRVTGGGGTTMITEEHVHD